MSFLFPIPIEKILGEIHEDFQIPRENPRTRELILAEFLRVSSCFPRPKVTRRFPRGFFQ